MKNKKECLGFWRNEVKEMKTEIDTYFQLEKEDVFPCVPFLEHEEEVKKLKDELELKSLILDKDAFELEIEGTKFFSEKKVRKVIDEQIKVADSFSLASSNERIAWYSALTSLKNKLGLSEKKVVSNDKKER